MNYTVAFLMNFFSELFFFESIVLLHFNVPFFSHTFFIFCSYIIRKVISSAVVSTMPETMQPVDLLVELVETVTSMVSPGDAQALGIGYRFREASSSLLLLEEKVRKNMHPFQDSDPIDRNEYFEPGVDKSVAPQNLYIASHFWAKRTDSGWLESALCIPWLPENMQDFDDRLS